MRRWSIGLVLGFGLVAAATAGAARPAQACGSGGNGRLVGDLALAALATVDLGFTVVDLAYLGKGQRPGPGYGAAEVIIAGSQAFGFSVSAVQSIQAGEVPIATLAMVAWTAALAVHGGYTVWRGPMPAEPPEQARRPAGIAWGLAPALLAGGSRRPGAMAGAVLHGRF